MGLYKVYYRFGIWLFCGGYFPIQNVTNLYNILIYNTLQINMFSKVQMGYKYHQLSIE
jgi:hypothetical protein